MNDDDNRFDIPEVFRRAMKDWEDGGSGGDDGGDNGRNRPPFPRPVQPFRISRTTWLIALVVVLFLSLSWIVTTYTDWLWFTELGYRSVWLTQWGVRVGSSVVFFVLAAGVLLLNWHIGRLRAIRSTPPHQPQLLQIPGLRWLITGAALVLTLGFSSSGGQMWEEFLLFFNRVPFGAADPVYGYDISFYLFELPIFRFLQGWLVSLLVITLIGLVPIYLLNRLPDIQQGRWQLAQSPEMRRHVAILLVLVLLLWAVGHGLSLFDLLYSPRGVVFGASYTDMNASRWALWVQMIVMVLAVLAALYNVVRLAIRPLLITGALWLAAAIVVGGIYPAVLQRFSVIPNEIELERPYIQYNIDATRLAFGLDKIERRTFELGDPLSEADIIANEAILKNVRLWDYRPLRDTYEQLQALRPYYEFGEIDIDRYEIDGQTRQVMLAARELNKAELPSRSWVNENLEFTHGYGVVMNPVDEVTSDGQPQFFIQDLPPRSRIDLEVTRPEIYYGELTTDNVFVSSGREEFSYPSGNENVYTSYAGTGGVPLDSYFKRIAFAIREGDANILLSNEINTGTRVQFHREIKTRVQMIAPFIYLDDDPYLIVTDDGRLMWMLDGYTVSNRFPYATPMEWPAIGRLNYIRNAVKITVDAYNGTVRFYLADPNDPIIRAYDRAFPGLLQPLDEMPADLHSHLRYPEDLFTIQRFQYLVYHMTDVRVFYNKEDQWEIATEVFTTSQSSLSSTAEQQMEPYYVLLPLPGETESEYLLIQPYTPAGKDNMVAWLAARNDPEYYGELVVYELPKQELVFGPIQVESRISQEPEISQQFSLWDQRGSSIIRGNLIVMPIEDNFLYVEPIYLRSDTSALPELKRIIVSSDERIIMRETLGEALADLFELPPGEVATIDNEEEEGEETAVPPTTEIPATDLTLDELIQSANAHFEAAEAAQRDGDWATYGAELDALQQDLQQLEALTQ
ncbi:MAG: UPF0182 family protein [Ardenticatenaceae bacterium]|nr:UPF0182 family protein [Ardenticatenaceae bacterium]